MPIDLTELGRKLRNIRQDILKISLDEVFARTNIPVSDLANMEGGFLEPTGDQILILSDIYNEPFQYFISYQKSATLERATDLYRMHGDKFTPSDRRQMQEFLLLCRFEHELESMMGGRPRTHEYKSTPDKKYKKGHGQENAEGVRRELNLADMPVENAFHLVRQLGCHVFRRRLGNSAISGVFIRHPEIGRCILLNYDEDVYRQKFSALHELGHAILDVDYDVNLTLNEDLASSETGRDWDDRGLREVRANSFAGRLLVPQNVVRQSRLGESLSEKANDILEVCLRYKVNYDVGLRAFKDAKRITDAEFQSLRQKHRIPKASKKDPELEGETALVQQRRYYILERGLSPDYVKTCFEAYHRNLISIGKLADVLRAGIDEVTSIALVYGEQLWGQT
jgi:Zn-dependent peptidase ImmA (M78 family)/transcriptional regulator with XRE-family HTH domain